MKINFTLRRSLCATAANATALHESVVVAHDQLRFDLLNRIHRNTNHDQQRSATEVELKSHSFREPQRQRAIERGTDTERQLRHVHARDEELGKDADGGK